MKIYTKTGDKGETSLALGGRVKKYDPRVQLYGSCDELNSSLGLALSFLPKSSSLHIPMLSVQCLLFELGSELAGYSPVDESGIPIPIIKEEDIQSLERWMDEWTDQLEPLKNFILPGGGHSSSFFHQARTICRRLERDMVEKRDNGLSIEDRSIVFINRLSDTFFLAARIANQEEGIQEPIWTSRSKPSSKK